MILKNIAVIDGSYFLHRSLKQPNLWEFRNSKLERTGGIYGFLNILQKEIKLIGNYYPIVCFDDGQSDRRLAIDDNYKKHREKLEDPDRKEFKDMSIEELDADYVYNYKLQRKKLIPILNAFGIPTLFFKHTEGDDLMYWLVKHSENSKILTDDKDLLQLLSETCSVRRPMHDDTIYLESFLKDNNYESILDFVKAKAFCGDGSDNIPGACFRVGEKSCGEFLKLYEHLKQNDDIIFSGNHILDFIKDETKLKKYCKDNGFKFKSAYCNFDEARYLKNLELVDLNKIKDSEFNDDLIYDAIRKVYKNSKVNEVLHMLNEYEIKSINTNIIFESLILSKHNIKN